MVFKLGDTFGEWYCLNCNHKVIYHADHLVCGINSCRCEQSYGFLNREINRHMNNGEIPVKRSLEEEVRVIADFTAITEWVELPEAIRIIDYPGTYVNPTTATATTSYSNAFRNIVLWRMDMSDLHRLCIGCKHDIVLHSAACNVDNCPCLISRTLFELILESSSYADDRIGEYKKELEKFKSDMAKASAAEREKKEKAKLKEINNKSVYDILDE